MKKRGEEKNEKKKGRKKKSEMKEETGNVRKCGFGRSVFRPTEFLYQENP